MSSSIILDEKILEYAILGGTILGGGGGGSPSKGKEFATIGINYTDLKLVDIDELDDDDLILTVSLVGAPNAQNKFLYASDFANTINLFKRNCDLKLGGIITNENGGEATVNGWLQAALTGLPLIDAPCNGRAHPTGVMGSMNLHKNENYITTQSFSGGNPITGSHVEGVVNGSIGHTSKLVRMAAVEAGGLVAVARNPVTVKYVKENAAIGGVSHAILIGEAYSKGLEISPSTAMKNLCKFLDGKILARGKVEKFEIHYQGGFDVGRAIIDGLEITFWNEYMTAEKNGERLATFPDLIMTFDSNTGMPLTSAMMKDDIDVIVFTASMSNLKLSKTMFDKELIASCESVIGKNLNDYNL